jgi:hypothetical protein
MLRGNQPSLTEDRGPFEGSAQLANSGLDHGWRQEQQAVAILGLHAVTHTPARSGNRWYARSWCATVRFLMCLPV